MQTAMTTPKLSFRIAPASKLDKVADETNAHGWQAHGQRPLSPHWPAQSISSGQLTAWPAAPMDPVEHPTVAAAQVIGIDAARMCPKIRRSVVCFICEDLPAR
jgi:hypothetical protein